ncbi:MAG TPA: Gfo/Idh/MocA family oxidoreductase [Tepidisphaeraceae bacterium]|jgi:predicted dehydrogenase
MSINVGIVGLGFPGQQHTKSLASLPGAKIAAFADLDAGRVGKFAAEHHARAYSDWRQMLEGEPALDAVILATPAKVRLEPIAAICDRGVALFCEKPPAVDMKTAWEAAALIRRAGIINSVGFQFRWSPLAGRMREMISARPRLFARIVVAWPVFSWVRQGGAPIYLYEKAKCGGPLIEQAIHYQDVLRYITADEPIEVMAMGELGRTEPRGGQQGRDCEETTALIARHASGMLTSHIHNWSHNGTLIQLQVVGEDFDLTWLMPAKEGGTLVGTIDGKAVNETDATDFYAEEIRGFIEAVARKDQTILRSDYTDACKSMAVCHAGAEAVFTQTRTHVTVAPAVGTP